MASSNVDMAASPVETLTHRERECLRLVASGYSSKQIAPLLSLQPKRVDKVIDAANRKLGVSSRMEAARLVAESENRGVNVIPGVTFPLPNTPPAPSIPPWDEQTRQPLTLREERSAFNAAGETTQLGLPRRRSGGTSNDLTTWQRVIWIAILSSLALLGVGVLTRGLSSLSDQIIMVPHSGR